MKRHLITGGAGFIGSHLAEELLRRGGSVRVVDDLSTGSLDNIAGLRDHLRFEFIEGSVTDAPLMGRLAGGADVIYHLAAAVGVQLVFNQPIRTIQTNIRGAEVVLEAAAREGKQIYVASTSEVYGKGVRIPLAETDDLLLGPTTCARWAYACSKAVDEFLALAYFKERGLQAVIGRFFNTVGPRQTGSYGMVIPRFITQALRDEDITVYGDGGQTRCFGHVHDVVRAVADLMEIPEACGEVFNIGNDQEISVLELANKVIATTGSRSRVRFLEFEEAFGPGFEDMARRVPNLAKLRSVMPWENLMDMDEILKTTVAHIRGGMG